MSRRREGSTRPDSVCLDLVCVCGRRLDRLTVEDVMGQGRQVTFLYDDVDRLGRAWAQGRVKGRAPAGVAEQMHALSQQGAGPFVRAMLCVSCGARPEMTVEPLVDELARALETGHRGLVRRVVMG